MSRAWPVPDIDPDAPVSINARRILAVRIGELWSYDPIMPHAERTRELHDARIAAKRLRYTLELFGSVFGPEGAEAIETVKTLQEDLGTLHDADVRIALIEDVRKTEADPSADSAGDAAASLDAMLGRERAARQKRHAAVAKRWERINRDGWRARLVSLSAMPTDA